MPKRIAKGLSVKKRVIIVDDHPPMRKGLAQLINQEPDLHTCGEAGNIPEALQVVESLKPDVIMVDLVLKDTSGLDLIKDLKKRFPSLPVLVLSMQNESVYAERALRAGARGYIMKEETTENVVEALRQVLRGEVYLSDKMSKRILDMFAGGHKEKAGSPVESLSDRELEVFKFIGQGHQPREIAQKLHLSVKTIESYREHIKIKLSLESAAELTQTAIQWMRSQKTG
jgi:DNA-binding NarL/FixJ family response regulator